MLNHLSFIDYFFIAIISSFIVPSNWSSRIKKQVDLKKEAKDFKKNGTIMFSWIAERYDGNKNKLYPIYNITLFTRAIHREVLGDLAIILGLKTKIEIDASVVYMTYSIIQAHVYYEFALFLS